MQLLFVLDLIEFTFHVSGGRERVEGMQYMLEDK
jgi:hypothetical protein